jgi:predicted SAM-dependent methyltransferase
VIHSSDVKKLVFFCLLLAAISGGYGLSRALPAWRSRTIISQYVSSHQTRKIQLGAGTVNLQGWLNTDIEPQAGQAYLDATKPFPFADGSIQYIFGEHVIEHLTYDDGLAMLRECYRVLSPGGKVRFATPDLHRLMALLDSAPPGYMDAKFKFHYWPAKPGGVAPAFIINKEMREWGHLFVYDEAALRESFAQAGFQSIRRFEPGMSDDEALTGVEARHNNSLIRPMNDYETMVLQGVR